MPRGKPRTTTRPTQPGTRALPPNPLLAAWLGDGIPIHDRDEEMAYLRYRDQVERRDE